MPADDAIIGHARQLAELRSDLERGNVTHAYLFAGPPHVGKMTVAKWFAKQLLTQGLTDEEAEDIRSRADRLIHPDLLVLDQLWIEDQCEDWEVIAQRSNVPQQHRSKSPKIMKTDTISIDDVRVIQDRLVETGVSPYRVCLIRSIERMRDEAGNALLKILEEPPAHRVFIFTTQAISRLLPTVTSRMRVLHFTRVPEREMAPLLSEMSDDEARFILHTAQGAPGTVIRLRDDPELLRKEKTLHTQAVTFWRDASAHARLKALAPLAERTPEAERLLFHLALALRETSQERPDRAVSLHRLVRGLQTNAHRGLLLQQFALSV